MGTLGRFIKDKRSSLKQKYPGFTIRALAARVGIHPSYLSKLERGEYAPLSPEKIAALARELGENQDLLMALGGKISDECARRIARNPDRFIALLETLDEPQGGSASVQPSSHELRRRELEELARRLRFEIQKRERLEQDLRRTSHQKGVILEHLDGILIEYIDMSYNFLWGTPNVQQFVTVPLDKASGQKCYKLLWGLDSPCQGCSVQRAIATKSPLDDEIFVIHDKTLMLRTVPILDENREVSGILRFGFDVSTLYAKLNEISEYEQRLRAALDSAQEGVWEWKIREGALTVSTYLKRVLGYDEPTLSDSVDTWIDRIHPDDREETMALVETVLTGESDFMACFFRMRRKDGSYASILGRGMVTERGEDGTPLKAMGTHTEAQAIPTPPRGALGQMERAERRSLWSDPHRQRILQKIVTQEIGVGYMLFDCARDTLLEINGSALQVLEMTRTEAMDRLCQKEIMGWRLADDGDARLFHADRPSRARYDEAVLVLRSGRVVTIGMYTLPVELYGSPHVIRVVIDINRRRQMEGEIGIQGRFEQVGTIATSIAQELLGINARTEQHLLDAIGTRTFATCPARHGTQAENPGPAWPFREKEDVRGRSALESALAGIRESGEMLNRLLSASSFSETRRGLVDVNAALEAMLNASIRSIAPKLAKDLRLAPNLPPLECSPGSLNCALFCLLTNAVRQCASSRDGAAPSGRIVVETALRDHAIHITMDSSRNTPPAEQAETPADGPPVDRTEGVQERLRQACDILHREHGASVFVKAGDDRKTGYLVILPLDARTEEPWT